MKLFRLTVLILVGLLSSPAHSADLLEVYKLALQSDPLLREADAVKLAAMEARPQARSALLPQLGFNATRTDQGSDGTSAQFGADGFFEIPINNDDDQTSLSVQLTQTLFRWDQWLSLRQADKIVAQAEVDYSSAQQSLMLRVATRYFDVLAARDGLESAQADKEAIARQLEQSETRFEVGLIAITDVQESRAAFDQAVAAEILAKRVLRTARENLRELTGAIVQDLENPDTSLPLVKPDPASEDAWVERALEQNLSLVSSRLGVQIAKDAVGVQRADHLPTLDLVVNKNEFDSDGSRLNLMAGGLDDIASDISSDSVQLQLNIPIYSGGRTSSLVRQRVFEHRAARERLERVARETERETRDAYLSVESDISTIRAFEQALASAETALQATEAGFEVGTRTTVDVLNARRDLLSARTNLERSRYDYIINLIRLKQAAGILSNADLAQVNGWLN
ncbi:MAG: TolC family outer membrane protein [Gammaproteobacteria bacterium]|nr:TolC family outer membrane protein [Gammaproteobacteria bacterium]NNF61445.1 TolC family outer membrane protein [Gammaproteobacteria bacterium]NNM20180.1 TolC family outer membrane protein [Gammaproteobacteria bacterium]